MGAAGFGAQVQGVNFLAAQVVDLDLYYFILGQGIRDVELIFEGIGVDIAQTGGIGRGSRLAQRGIPEITIRASTKIPTSIGICDASKVRKY